MAKSATSDSVAEAKRGPNFKAALSILRSEIGGIKERISKLNGDIAEKWGKVDGGHKVDRVGAKLFMALDKLDHEDRIPAYRALIGLISVSGWPPMEDDLVDQAEGKPLDPRSEVRESARDEAEDEIEAAVQEVEKAPKGKTKPVTAAQARAAAKSHLRAVPDAPAPASADPDADLAGEA